MTSAPTLSFSLRRPMRALAGDSGGGAAVPSRAPPPCGFHGSPPRLPTLGPIRNRSRDRSRLGWTGPEVLGIGPPAPGPAHHGGYAARRYANSLFGRRRPRCSGRNRLLYVHVTGGARPRDFRYPPSEAFPPGALLDNPSAPNLPHARGLLFRVRRHEQTG